MAHTLDPAIRETFAEKQKKAKKLAPMLRHSLTEETLNELMDFISTGSPLRQE
jgi:hypothetical protein